MKIKLATLVRSNGDGSASVMFFRNEIDAEAYASKDDERLCEDISTVIIEVDEQGNLLMDDGERQAKSDELFGVYYALKNKKRKSKDETLAMEIALKQYQEFNGR